MKKDHRDYDVSNRVLNSMGAEDLINFHDKLHRKSYYDEPNPSKEHLKKKILNKFMNYTEMHKKLNEEAPTVAAGNGAIAGIGVGDDGEPGVTRKKQKKYADQNKAEAPVISPMQRRKTLKQFMSGV